MEGKMKAKIEVRMEPMKEAQMIQDLMRVVRTRMIPRRIKT
jgi:hypothetical protein